jgi:hypothetical protein
VKKGEDMKVITIVLGLLFIASMAFAGDATVADSSKEVVDDVKAAELKAKEAAMEEINASLRARERHEKYLREIDRARL